MLLEQFTLQSESASDSSFIERIQIWAHNTKPIWLTKCDFNTACYTPRLFVKWGIHYPDNIKLMINKRQAEFLAGRVCAKHAFLASARFNSSSLPDVKVGEHRAPIWPKGFAGSITHSASKAICVLGRATAVKNIGIDIEGILSDATASEVAKQIHNQKEWDLLLAEGIPAHIATTLIFSAKESLFKALYRDVRDYFGFEKARVCRFDNEECVLSLELDPPFAERYNLSAVYTAHVYIDAHEVITCVMQER